MIQALAQALNVEIRYTPASIDVLTAMIDSSKVDMVAGGLADNLIIELGLNVSQGYQLTHTALLVEDKHYEALQQAVDGTLGRPLVLGTNAKVRYTTAMREELASSFVGDNKYVPIRIVYVASHETFLSSYKKLGIDAYLTSAEYGALLAILHPTFTMYPSFGRKLPTYKVVATAGSDRSFEEFIDVWIALNKQKGLFDKLYKHWVQIQKYGDKS
jgi:ABC-type amino acid transport substrate-binding protein